MIIIIYYDYMIVIIIMIIIIEEQKHFLPFFGSRISLLFFVFRGLCPLPPPVPPRTISPCPPPPLMRISTCSCGLEV